MPGQKDLSECVTNCHFGRCTQLFEHFFLFRGRLLLFLDDDILWLSQFSVGDGRTFNDPNLGLSLKPLGLRRRRAQRNRLVNLLRYSVT